MFYYPVVRMELFGARGIHIPYIFQIQGDAGWSYESSLPTIQEFMSTAKTIHSPLRRGGAPADISGFITHFLVPTYTWVYIYIIIYIYISRYINLINHSEIEVMFTN